MRDTLFALARPLVSALDPETAHRLAIAGLRLLPPAPPLPADPRLAVRAFGLAFPNPVGLAAGFDKHAEVTGEALALGFGFVEAGGVTPLPQPGNPRPRVFRLPEDGAVINRYGLNSEGLAPVRARLAARRRVAGVVGVNIGANKDSADRTADYVTLVEGLADVADYLSVNISSPNTPGLRDLQGREALDGLLVRVVDARDRMARQGRRTPLLVKIAPDLAEDDLDDVVAVCEARAVDGLIIANTTVARPPSLRGAARQESGGLSGRPLFAPSTVLLARAALRLEGRLPLVGVGGIDGPEAALAKISAGATLVQFYTAMVFEGPGLAARIVAGLAAALDRSGAESLDALRGRDAAAIAASGLS